MRTGSIVAALAVSIALAACTRTLDPSTPEEQARETHAGIVGGANTLLRRDRLGHLATDGEVERVGTTCQGDSCAFGLVFISRVSDFSIENAELELLRERRAVAFLSKASRT